MKKFVFALAVLLLAVPTWALNVQCAVTDTNLVTVAFSGARGGASPVRGMAFNISLGGNGTLSNVVCLSADYGYQIYPGSIQIDGSGNVTNWGSCKCSGSYPGTLDAANAMTIEMGSLYEDGVDPDPCDAGDLVSFRVSGSGTIHVTIVVNPIRGGVVNEDASTTTPAITECDVILAEPTCLNSGAPEYTAWVNLGKPNCWCFRKQCRGDIDGVMTGPFAVAIPDLTLFKAAFNMVVIPTPPGPCADLDHVQTGPFRCGIPDLTIFKLYFNQVVVPQCDAAPVITGPYNFWTN